MNIRYLCAQPATDYYAWQVEVMLDNFLSMGISDNSIDVVCAYDNEIPQSFINLRRRFYNVRFFFYKDERVDRTYPPSVQAHILKKHFAVHTYLSKEAIFFHDCDFVFTKKFDFHPFLNDDNWYFSNCTSYLGYDYIVSKSEALLEMMCNTVDICSCKVRANKDKAGGAQKLMKDINASYWESVERDSMALYKLLQNSQHIKKDEESYGIQAWTASMWAELWNGWKLGKSVEVPEEFSFAWATDVIDKWDQVSFFHNAGVQTSDTDMFFKGNYMSKLPYEEQLELSDSRCSSMYFDMVKKTGENTCLK